jgi:hypothetical protein
VSARMPDQPARKRAAGDSNQENTHPAQVDGGGGGKSMHG